MRVFVTGVSSGIGRQLAIDLVAAGHEVYGIARRDEELRTLAQQLGDERFSYAVCDVADPASREAVRGEIKSKQWLPDVVVLNAAIDLEDELPGLNIEFSERTMRTNYDGCFFWISEFIAEFQARGSGQFIAVSSIFAHWPDRASVSYSASKAALSMMMRGLRTRYAGSGLLFKLLYLGPVATAINPRFAEDDSPSSPVVASVSSTSAYLVKMMDSRRENHYFPLLVWLVFTFLRWLPDKVFEVLTSPLKR